ncbi:peroxisomal biogenesis factor 3 [Chelonus insularis]|uniref:peroxisomal biogenesis factor 3 n=1 Tax=Chelonus insularis TaxID=460826 RepID=UPI00158A6B3C|nr:peroxisomal biogenesis factor 3 [Chelonus insularis]
MSYYIRKLFNRNYQKYLVSGVVISGFVLLIKYGQHKLEQWRKQEVQQMLVRSKRRQHFESIEKSCHNTITKLSKCVKVSVLETLDSSSVIQDLKDGKCDKIVSWNKLKLYSFCRTVVIIYANTILAIILRIQLSLTSAHMFKQSQEITETYSIDSIVQEQYLTLCSYFVEDGIGHLIGLVKEKVEEVIGAIPLIEKLGIKDLEDKYWKITSVISVDKERDPVKNLAKYVLPPSVQETMNPALEKLINSTLDLLESNEVQSLMQSSVRSGFVLILDRLSNNFINVDIKNDPLTPESTNGHIFTELNNIKIPMAKIIPMLNRQVDNFNNDDLHSTWIKTLIEDEKLRNFGANIYEAFSF